MERFVSCMRLLQSVVDSLSKTLGCTHLSLSPILVVSAEVLPVLRSCAAFWDTQRIRFETDARGLLCKIVLVYINTKSNVLVLKISEYLLAGLLKDTQLLK